MAAPVLISRIQNRRGTQTQFDALYPSYPGSGLQILQPGEIALCTDTNKVFIGNVNGTFVEIATGGENPPGSLEALVIPLAPSPSTYTAIPDLDYTPTPFFSLLYSIVDQTTTDPNDLGTNFSKNGELKITAVGSGAPVPATLVDESVEINATAYDIYFMAAYNAGKIRISYLHNFPGTLTFSTSSIIWAPF